jgi:hypothetical protein
MVARIHTISAEYAHFALGTDATMAGDHGIHLTVRQEGRLLHPIRNGRARQSEGSSRKYDSKCPHLVLSYAPSFIAHALLLM